jgi:hypothetical protein
VYNVVVHMLYGIGEWNGCERMCLGYGADIEYLTRTIYMITQT